ncbi:MAG: ribose-phosphate pyrophosphokinase [Fastidiosipilaceae bacterium]|jgi:ribose-phosphate pyrophosphokinase
MTNDPNPGEDAFSQQSVDTIADLTIDTTNNSNYYIYDQYGDNLLDPVGPIGIIALPGCGPFTARVNNYLYKRRLKYLNKTPDFINTRPGFLRKNYLIDVEFHRQPTGEGKTLIRSSVRGHDLFIIADVLGRNTTYTLFGNEKHMSPDELYQDLKRIILACSGKARRINVIMPFLYESRQHKRNARESLDCAYMLQELDSLGVANIITFDAHDPRVSNAVPTSGFEDIPATYQIIKSLKDTLPDLTQSNEDLMVISPDEGAITRAMYYATLLGSPIGTFYKRRDYTTLVNGHNPIVAHEFLGNSPADMNVLIVDDMISSGGSMLEIAKEMKERRAKKVYCTVTFALFTNGLEDFDKAYEDGIIDLVFGTNLMYRTPELLERPWYKDVDVTKFVALIVDAVNHDASLSRLVDSIQKIKSVLT